MRRERLLEKNYIYLCNEGKHISHNEKTAKYVCPSPGEEIVLMHTSSFAPKSTVTTP